MPIDTVHAEYAANETKWSRARDVLAGADMVKGKNDIYLPRLDGQTEPEYIAYRDRTPFWNATSRTHEGLVGMLFRKDPTITLPTEGTGADALVAQSFWADADLRGNSLEVYCRKIAGEVLSVGRCATLVDWSEAEEQPYLVMFKAEEILNWRTERIGGAVKLSLVVLKETVIEPSRASFEVGATSDDIDKDDDPYTDKEKDQLRVLRLIPTGNAEPTPEGEEQEGDAEGWQYVVEIWHKKDVKKGNKTSTRWELKEIRTPTRIGRPLTEIPFFFHGADNADPEVDRPPLDDLIEMNLDHYRTSADYKHGLHFTALPTAWVAGFGAGTTLRIGSTEAWVSDNPEAKAGYLEFSGKGLDEFSKYLDSLEKKMAVLGARLLEIQKKEAETAEAMQIRQGGEVSVLQHISNVMSSTLSSAVKQAIWWAGGPETPNDLDDEEVSVGINTDFVSAKLASQDVVNLVSAWMQGGISRDTLYWNLGQGEILPPGRTAQEELELIELEGMLAGAENPEPGVEDEEDEEGEGEEIASGNPYSVNKRNGKFVVIKTTTGKVMGTFDTEDEAMKQFRALEAAHQKEKR